MIRCVCWYQFNAHIINPRQPPVGSQWPEEKCEDILTCRTVVPGSTNTLWSSTNTSIFSGAFATAAVDEFARTPTTASLWTDFPTRNKSILFNCYCLHRTTSLFLVVFAIDRQFLLRFIYVYFPLFNYVRFAWSMVLDRTEENRLCEMSSAQREIRRDMSNGDSLWTFPFWRIRISSTTVVVVIN